MFHNRHTKLRRHWNSLYVITELQNSSAKVFVLCLAKSLSFVIALLVENVREKLHVGGRLAQYKLHPFYFPRPCCLLRRGRVQVRRKFGWNWLQPFISIWFKHKGRRKEEMNAASACVCCCSNPSPNIARFTVLNSRFHILFLFRFPYFVNIYKIPSTSVLFPWKEMEWIRILGKWWQFFNSSRRICPSAIQHSISINSTIFWDVTNIFWQKFTNGWKERTASISMVKM
jgi:hypothetical protein